MISARVQQLAEWAIAHRPHPHLSKSYVYHAVAVTVGVSLCVGGSALALNSEYVLAMFPFYVPHALYDAFAYTVHAFGSLPVLSHGEKLWRLLQS